MEEPTLGLVVVGYLSDDVWEEFFSSLRASSLMPRAIVVAENGPSVSKVLSQQEDLPLTIIHLPDNPGYGAAINIGVAQLPSDCDWVIIANPDVTLTVDALANLVKAKEIFPQTAILGPRILTADGAIYPSARAIPGVRIGIGHALFGQIFPANPWTQKYLGNYEDRQPRTAGWVSGALLAINRAVFSQLEGFDQRYFMFFEDVDFGYRAKMAGYRSVYVPTAIVTHTGAHATSRSASKMVRAHHKSAEIFLTKLYPKKSQYLLRLALITGLRLRGAIESQRLEKLDGI
jgi:N-acetylglucosaminyl-diphospho-decaprenol L-rhamnosyltransferase